AASHEDLRAIGIHRDGVTTVGPAGRTVVRGRPEPRSRVGVERRSPVVVVVGPLDLPSGHEDSGAVRTHDDVLNVVQPMAHTGPPPYLARGRIQGEHKGPAPLRNE